VVPNTSKASPLVTYVADPTVVAAGPIGRITRPPGGESAPPLIVVCMMTMFLSSTVLTQTMIPKHDPLMRMRHSPMLVLLSDPDNESLPASNLDRAGSHGLVSSRNCRDAYEESSYSEGRHAAAAALREAGLSLDTFMAGYSRPRSHHHTLILCRLSHRILWL
jgi:hypothetical protein